MNTLVDVLIKRAYDTPHQTAFTFAGSGQGVDVDISYSEILCRAYDLSTRLIEKSSKDTRTIVSVPAGPGFIEAMFGCFIAGIIAVPAFPPVRGESIARFRSVFQDCKPDIIITTAELNEAVQIAVPDLGTCAVVLLESGAGSKIPANSFNLRRNSLALLQYTSGSTGRAKGVMISHANLMHNSECIAKAFRHSVSSRGVIWLPPYHDMGLVGGIFQPIYVGFPTTLMSPQQFLQHPFNWLKRISDGKATTSGGPNLAFDLCVRHISDEQKDQLNLGSWKMCFSGSETVHAETIARFCRSFRQCGFRGEAFFPCYGLAESTLIVSGNSLQRAPRVLRINAGKFRKDKITLSRAAKGTIRKLVSCGQVCTGVEVKIIDPETLNPLAENEIGEIWIRGKSVASGYWQNDLLTKQVFGALIQGELKGPYLRTGDLGFFRDQQLYITGRLKELIIIGGNKIHPEDIENFLLRSNSNLGRTRNVAFADGAEQGNGIVILQELLRPSKNSTNQIGEKMRAQVSSEFGVAVSKVIFVKRSTLPVTLTGKIQRIEAARRFLAGGLPELARYVPVIDSQAYAGKNVIENKSVKENLLCIFKEILQRENIDTQEHFFALGGTSLQLTQLIHLIQERTGLRLDVEDVVANPTIHSLEIFIKTKIEQIEKDSIHSSTEFI